MRKIEERKRANPNASCANDSLNSSHDDVSCGASQVKTEPEIDVVNSDDEDLISMTSPSNDAMMTSVERTEELEVGEIVLKKNTQVANTDETKVKPEPLLSPQLPTSPPITTPPTSSDDDEKTLSPLVGNPFSIDRLLRAKQEVTSPAQQPRNWKHMTSSASTGVNKLNAGFPLGMLPLFPPAAGQPLSMHHPSHALAWLHMQERISAMFHLARRHQDD